MEIKLFKDSKGKEHMGFIKGNIDEYNEMGNKVDDFEILQVLGQGSYGFIAKVKSLLNHKIYAMKLIDFTNLGQKEIELCENETKLLSKLNHPLITKYYKSIIDEKKVYIIMEFMDNGDLGGLMKASKELGKPIEEEKMFQIFIQAMKGLSYIHSKKLIHRDIKPENLFISVDGIVKLGDFGVSASFVDNNKNNENYRNINEYNDYKSICKLNQNSLKNSTLGDVECNQTVVGTPPFMSPEMLNELNYGLKTDVYSMGVTFFQLCFWGFPRIPRESSDGDYIFIDSPIKNNKDVYSPELINIIQTMIEKDKDKRPNSEQILNSLITEFNKKYSSNSSIGSVLSCLYAYEDFTKYLKRPQNTKYITDNSGKMPISYAYLYGINSVNNNTNEDWNNSLYKIRNSLTNENYRYSGNKEIDARHILSFLLGKMHKELNGKNNTFRSRNSHQIESSDQKKALNDFVNSSIQVNKSPIFDYFYGIMKTKSLCANCSVANYSFNNYYFVSFNIDLAQKKKNNLSLKDLFIIQNDICITIDTNKLKYCNQCKSVKSHFERKQFYSFPPYLVICLDRGYNCQNKTKILYNLTLDLENNCFFVESPKLFMLVGILKRLDKNEKEHYISLYYDFQYNSWILRDDNFITKIKSPMEHNEGTEMIFFYKAFIDNTGNYTRRNSSNQMRINYEFYN